jgi:hypothetical protein
MVVAPGVVVHRREQRKPTLIDHVLVFVVTLTMSAATTFIIGAISLGLI